MFFIMQQLHFEVSWEKALAAQDRREIERVFCETKNQNSESIFED